MSNTASLLSSEAYKIFKKFGVRSGSLWAKNDKQDVKIDSILDALYTAGFKSSKKGPYGESTYVVYLSKGAELVYYNSRTGVPGLQAIILINPTPPDPPQHSIKIKDKPEFGNNNRGNLESAMYNDLKQSNLTQFTAEQWKASSIKRGTFDKIDKIAEPAGAKISEVWPARFHQIMRLLIKKGKVRVEKMGSKNIYNLI